MLGYTGAGTTTVSNGVVIYGFIKQSSHGFTLGAPLYLSDTTAGNMTATAPGSSGDVVRIVGYAVDSNTIFFNPGNTYVTVS